MDRNDIRARTTDLAPRTGNDAMARARSTARRLGIWDKSQQMGNRWPVGCIALEITQRCNRCGICLAVNGNLYDVLDEPRLVKLIHAATPHIAWLRNRPRTTVGLFLRWLARHPSYLFPAGRWGLRKLWSFKKDLLCAGGRIHALAFLVHGFMDADELDCERVQSCAFKTMTATGPVCMCVYNAGRKEYILNSTK
jgi:hypothetical protein